MILTVVLALLFIYLVSAGVVFRGWGENRRRYRVDVSGDLFQRWRDD